MAIKSNNSTSENEDYASTPMIRTGAYVVVPLPPSVQMRPESRKAAEAPTYAEAYPLTECNIRTHNTTYTYESAKEMYQQDLAQDRQTIEHLQEIGLQQTWQHVRHDGQQGLAQERPKTEYLQDTGLQQTWPYITPDDDEEDILGDFRLMSCDPSIMDNFGLHQSDAFPLDRFLAEQETQLPERLHQSSQRHTGASRKKLQGGKRRY